MIRCPGLGRLLIAMSSLPLAACQEPAAGVRWLSGEVLTHPGQRSVLLSLIPAEPVELYVDFGPRENGWRWRTPQRHVAARATAVFRLDGLEPGQHYRYRVRYRRAAAEGSFDARPERTFHKLRAPGDPVRFGFSTDSHLYLGWALAHCGDDATELARVNRTLDNIRRSETDFLILGGDEAQMHCVRCPPCRVDGESAGTGTVRSLLEAQLRYRVTRRGFEPLAGEVAIVPTLGNHDGEAGFGDSEGRCGQYADTRQISRLARMDHFPVPTDGIDGAADGSYFAFESGDALFVILDVMSHTTSYPRAAEDWSLGDEQLRWLERTLRRSERRWKLLFAHHLVGGSDWSLCYTYGRGGIKSTEDGTTAGRFRGEQARVHALMLRHGAQGFFIGHDHVFAAGEKDGILYVVGGQAGGPARSFWTFDPVFNEAYDYDADGKPDYLVDKGFVRVTVEGPERVTIEYVKTDVDDAAENGRVLFQTTLDGNRR
jgi:hypothetical protein